MNNKYHQFLNTNMQLNRNDELQYPPRTRRNYKNNTILNPRRVDKRNRDVKKIHLSAEHLFSSGILGSMVSTHFNKTN